MRLLESRKGLSCFAFEHSEEYQQTQFKFLSAVESMEPNNIVVRAPPAAQRPLSPHERTAAAPGVGMGVETRHLQSDWRSGFATGWAGHGASWGLGFASGTCPAG